MIGEGALNGQLAHLGPSPLSYAKEAEPPTDWEYLHSHCEPTCESHSFYTYNALTLIPAHQAFPHRTLSKTPTVSEAVEQSFSRLMIRILGMHSYPPPNRCAERRF